MDAYVGFCSRGRRGYRTEKSLIEPNKTKTIPSCFNLHTPRINKANTHTCTRAVRNYEPWFMELLHSRDTDMSHCCTDTYEPCMCMISKTLTPDVWFSEFKYDICTKFHAMASTTCGACRGIRQKLKVHNMGVSVSRLW